MRKNFNAKTYLYPMPVLLIGTYQEDGTPNLMNAAWGGIYNTNQIGICLSENHKTTQDILKRKAFTVSMATEDYVKEADFVGIASANQTKDKIKQANLHAIKSEMVDAPSFEEFPMTLECEFVSYNDEFLIGNIKNVSADDSILDENGKIDREKLKPITYDPIHHSYIALGKTVGHAFQDGKALK